MRLAGVALHLLGGLLCVSLVFPLLPRGVRQRIKQLWSRHLLFFLGIELEVRGSVIDGALLVANHISWVDIFVINTARPTAFVAKSEVRDWPLIGYLAAKTETIFIERGRSREALHVAHRMAELLAAGRDVAVFPEGTTSDGSEVLPFHAALLQPAISVDAPVQPLALLYRNGDGSRATAPAYVGETSFSECLAAILATPGLRATLHCLSPHPAGGRSRRELADELRAGIGAALPI